MKRCQPCCSARAPRAPARRPAPAPQQPERLFADALFTPPSVRIVRRRTSSPCSPAMRDYIDARHRAPRAHPGPAAGVVRRALPAAGSSSSSTTPAMTRNAAEAFAARSGNCLSLVIMTAAFAKELGLSVRYQNVFVDETWSRSGDFYLVDRPREPVARAQAGRRGVRHATSGIDADDRLPAARRHARPAHVGDRRADDRRDVHEQPRRRIADARTSSTTRTGARARRSCRSRAS